MKLPHHLLRTYREYKERERSLLVWIEETAAASGYVFQTGKDKLKGRARTLARRATTTQKPDNDKIPATSSISPEEPAISILEILAPIEAITQDPRISSIPKRILDQFTAIHDLRKACLDWFKVNTNQCDAETRKRNDKHAFPLKVVQEAMRLLRSKSPTPQPVSSGQGPSTDTNAFTIEATKNMFSCLSLEETDDSSCLSANAENATSSRHSTACPPKIPKLTKEEQMQDEFNMAKFCMLRDIQELEDFMVLELVRYSLDQANADLLPFLSNLAIDIVAKMQSLLYQSFPWEKFELGFLDTIVVPNEEVIWSSPLLRMQNAVSTQVKKKQGVQGLKMYPTAGMAFNPNYPYFGASAEEQMLLEQLFLEKLFSIEQKRAWKDTIFFVDSVPQYVQPYALPGRGGENYYAVNAAGAFGIRIALLATVILKDNSAASLSLLQNIGSKHARLEASRQKFWKSSEYRAEVPAALWKDRMQIMLERQEISYTNYERFVTDKATALSAYHMVCTLNQCNIRMRYATTSIAAMEVCNIVKILAQLWNLLREEERIDIGWPDMEFLLSTLDEGFFFKPKRPTSVRSDPGAIRSRILFGMGWVKADLKKIWKTVEGIGIIKSRLRLKEHFNLSCYPLYAHLTRRGELAVGTLDGAVDAELVATASVVPDMIGKEPQTVSFNFDAQIENKPALWKLRDQGPGLQSVELLAVVKKGLQKEFRMIGFNYLAFEQVTLQLVSKMAENLKIVRDLPAAVKSSGNLVQKLRFIMLNIIENKDVELLPKVASILKQWLPENGHVGVKGLDIIEQRPVNPRCQLSSLRPEVLKIVKSVVKRCGLREDVFSRDQLNVSSVAVTGTLEKIIQTAWADHKIHKKTTKLESGRLTHPDLDLS